MWWFFDVPYGFKLYTSQKTTFSSSNRPEFFQAYPGHSHVWSFVALSASAWNLTAASIVMRKTISELNRLLLCPPLVLWTCSCRYPIFRHPSRVDSIDLRKKLSLPLKPCRSLTDWVILFRSMDCVGILNSNKSILFPDRGSDMQLCLSKMAQTDQTRYWSPGATEW